MTTRRILLFLLVTLGLLAGIPRAIAAAPTQRTFTTPEGAAQALHEAVRGNESIASSQQAEDLRHLASARGCTLCHREAPSSRGPDGVTPLAPSWREIAARYAGRGDAEAQLTRIVMEGADPAERHWKDRLDFTRMGGNAPHVSADEARALVRWILASP